MRLKYLIFLALLIPFIIHTNASSTEYTITFHETGLPKFTFWSIKIDNQTYSNDTNVIIVELPPGVYSYKVLSVPNFASSPSSGIINLTSSQTINIIFTQVNFTITFNEKGLPSGTSWGVIIGGKTYNTTSSSISITLPKGNYNYKIITPQNYVASIPSGSISLSNDTTVNITFTPVVDIYIQNLSYIAIGFAVVAAVLAIVIRLRGG